MKKSNVIEWIARPTGIIALLAIVYFAMIPGAMAGCVTGGGTAVDGALVQLRDYTQYFNYANTTGCYGMPEVPIGKYFMWTTATGFAPNITSINVTTGDNTKDIKMSLCRANFTDVSCSDWHYAYVFYLYDHAVTTGTSLTTFSPDATVTRAQTATFIARAKGLTYTGGLTDFLDVPPGHWAYNSIMAARQAGIISGYSAEYFGPEDPVTRGQISKMVSNAAGITYTGSGIADFLDVPPSHWAYSYIMAARQNNLISGYSSVSFGPEDQALRSHMAKMISNMMLLPP